VRRRELLRLGLTAVAGIAASGGLAACIRRQGSSAGGAPPRGLIGARVRAGARQGLDVFQAGEDYVAGLPNYLAVGLGVRGANVSGADARLWLVPSADPEAAVPAIGPVAAPWYGYTHPEPGGPQGANAADVRFDRPGIWTVVVEAASPRGRLLGTAALEVKANGSTSTKVPGDRALPSLTPTVGDHRGVEPICTREPPCPMHQVTLSDAIRAGRPLAFIVATPRFCMSRTCGPNLEELIGVAEEVGDRASFVHAEVYLNDHPETIAQHVVSPTFREWGMQSEPWLFLIDRTGVIGARFQGPVTAGQIRRGLDPLLG
jgi:hypothetical protein